MATTLISNANGKAVKETLALVYSVFKLRIGFAIMFTALAGVAVAPGQAPGQAPGEPFGGAPGPPPGGAPDPAPGSDP